MTAERTLIRGGRVVTLDPTIGDFERADVLMDGKEIASVGPNLIARGVQVIDASNMIVMPGLVDAHRHAWQGGLPHTLPDGTLGDYIAHMLLGYAPRFRPEDVYLGTLWSALSALDSGITTMMDWSHIQNSPEHTDAAIQGLRESGMRAVFAYGHPLPGPEWVVESALPHPEDARRVRASHFSTDDELVTMAMALRGPELSTMDVTQQDWTLARDLGLPISIHVGNGSFSTPFRAVERLYDAGLMGPDVQYVHNTSLSNTDIARIGETGGTAVVTPAVELQMGFGWPALNRLRAAGVVTGLGTDVVTSTGADLFGQMHVAHQFGRAFALDNEDEQSPTVRTVIEMATIHGARVLGLGDQAGTLTPGKQADIVLLRADGPNLAPVRDPIAAITLGAHSGNVDSVFVAGRPVKRDGRLLHPRIDAIRQRVLESADFLRNAIQADALTPH